MLLTMPLERLAHLDQVPEQAVRAEHQRGPLMLAWSVRPASNFRLDCRSNFLVPSESGWDHVARTAGGQGGHARPGHLLLLMGVMLCF